MIMKSSGRRSKAIVAALAIASAVAMVLTGCSSGTTGGTSGNNDKVTLTLLDHYGNPPMSTGLTALINQWNKENPNIQVKQQIVQFDDLLTTLNVRQSAGQGADLMSAYALWGGQLAANGVLAKPPANVAQDIKDNYAKAAVGAVTGADGNAFGYPTELTTYALFYNKKLLADAGYSAPPKTWDELKSMAKKLTQKDSSGNTKVLGLSVIQDGDMKTAHPFYSLLNADGGQFLDSKGNSAMDQKAKDVMQLESDLAASGATDTSIMPTKAFPTGGVAMAIQAGWWVGTLKDQMKDAYKDVGVVSVPGPEAGERGSLAYAFFMGVNAHSKHQAQAWKFLTWLNSHKGTDGASQMGKFLATSGLIPPRTADATILGPQEISADPNLKPLYEAADFAMAESGAPNAYKAKTSLHNALMKILVDHASVDKTFDSLVAEINKK